jgi:hypothetical protein
MAAKRCTPGWSTRWMRFCESIAFSSAQTERVFAGRELGLPVKLHAEQLSDRAARSWPRASRHCPATTWNGCLRRRPGHGAAPARWRCCCPAPSTFCAKRAAAHCLALRRPACPWRWQPTTTPAARPAVAAAHAQHGLHAVSPDARRGAGGVTVPRRARAGPADRGRLAAGLRADLVLWDVTTRANWPMRWAPTRAAYKPSSRAQVPMTSILHPAAGHAPLLVSMPHIGTTSRRPARPLCAARPGSVEDTDWHWSGSTTFCRALGASVLVPAYLALRHRPEPPAGRRAHVPRRVQHRAVPDALLHGDAAVPRVAAEPDAAERARRREALLAALPRCHCERRAGPHAARTVSRCCGTRTASAV